MRTVYVNGEYLPETEAKVSIFDRGFLMADGVYEVTSVLDGKLIDFDGHAIRLSRSLNELQMRNPISKEDLLEVHRELVRVNEIDEGLIYLQITRGSDGDRDFAFPDPDTTEPTIVLFTQSKPGMADSPAAKKGAKVISIEDIRWGRRDIKTVQLLYPSMGKMMAKKAGCDDAWMVEDGFVTEGTSNNAYIVMGNKIITRALSNEILHGITRAAVLRFAKSVTLPSTKRSRRMRRLPHQPAPLSCQWSRSTAWPWAMEHQARSRRVCARSIWKKCARRRCNSPCQGAGRVRSALFHVLLKRNFERFFLRVFRVGLIAGFPCVHGHAVKQFTRFFLAHVDAAFVCGLLIPARQAIAAKAG